MSSHDFAANHALSIAFPQEFWGAEAEHLSWTKFPNTILNYNRKEPTKWQWFPDGKICASYNLVTKHIVQGRGDQTAFVWDSPVTSRKRRISYRELQTEIEALSGVLRDLGVRAGQRILIYSSSTCLRC